MPKNSIPLYWWSEIKIQGKTKENYGDLLGPYLVKKISGQRVRWTKPGSKRYGLFKQPVYVTIGSVLGHIRANCIVWGSGIIKADENVKSAKFLSVRGPRTRKRLMDLGYEVPKIYGDPAILLPRFYHPEVERTHVLGIIPHISDHDAFCENYKPTTNEIIIDFRTNDIEKTTREILSCQRIVSSSLHGLILAHAYGIPAVWQPFSQKLHGDNIKFADYFESVKMQPYHPDPRDDFRNMTDFEFLFDRYETSPSAEVLESMRVDLMAVCPFKKEAA